MRTGMKKPIKNLKMKITFPNESHPIDAPTFKWSEFKVSNIFDDVVFGWWDNVYIKVSKVDYDKHLNWLEMASYGD